MRRAGLAAGLVLAVVVLVAGGCTPAAQPQPLEDPRRPIITVTSFDFPESETLAELYGQAMRQHGYPVEVVARLGPRDIVQPALEQGRVDLVLGYLGTTLNFLYEKRVATADPQRPTPGSPKRSPPGASACLPLPRPRTATALSSLVTWPAGASWHASATSPRSPASSSSAALPNVPTGRSASRGCRTSTASSSHGSMQCRPARPPPMPWRRARSTSACSRPPTATWPTVTWSNSPTTAGCNQPRTSPR